MLGLSEIEEIEQELADLREGLDDEVARPAVSEEAAERRREWVERSRREIARLETLLSRDGAS